MQAVSKVEILDVQPNIPPQSIKAENVSPITISNGGSSKKATFRKFAAENRLLQHAAAFDERKFLADRCRMIKAQAFEYSGGSFNSGVIHMAIMGIENYLMSARTSLSMQMLGDLQQAGYNGFNAWCAKYGV